MDVGGVVLWEVTIPIKEIDCIEDNKRGSQKGSIDSINLRTSRFLLAGSNVDGDFSLVSMGFFAGTTDDWL